MQYYSTNGNVPFASLEKAVVKGLAEDKGLYMPERIKTLSKDFFDNIQDMSLQEIAYHVADCFFGEDVDAAPRHHRDARILGLVDKVHTDSLVHKAGAVLIHIGGNERSEV